ncbi:MAG: aldehyde ferredoxin oxidoreductase family protein [Chloroflexota bacterium]|nr:aldehyde ferredoxin oxidoreductase family protein [Chloroflexota bacterium]MDE3100640.1 aldehyde ferredoxin oxidoreductase family protein [Chloroflexota bacterium]
MTAAPGPAARSGWWGRILRIDLTARRTWSEEIDEATYRRLPGGRALIARYLLREVPPGTDPLSAENRLVFAPGVLTGAPLSGASRHSVGAKSPLSGGFGEAEVGGFWGAELKHAGWDGIVVSGAADRPVYVWIKDDGVEIRDAAHLWGLEVGETEETLKAEVGERLARVCEIGPAGENLVRFAVVANDYKDVAGRSGMGAVMGSKKLKAIVVRGGKTFPLADGAKIKQVGRNVADTLQQAYWGQHNYGTGLGLDGYTKIGGFAVRNFDGGMFDGAGEISAEALLEKGYRIKMEACWACSVRCKKVVKLEAPYPVDPKYGGPEFESTAALGPQCGVGDLTLIAKLNERCNALGLDTISFGSSVAWLMEMRRSGVVPDAAFDGEPAEFGNGRAVLAATDAVAHRRGYGDLIADGSAAAARRIGAGADRLTTVKGLEIAMHDPRQRTEFGRALRVSYATSPTGGDHLGGNRPDKSARDIVGMCFFLKYDDAALASIVNAVTGWDVTAQEVATIGERGVTLARLFNLREGFSADDDHLPPKVMRPHVSGPLSKLTLDDAGVRDAVVAYYRQRGWSDDGRPTSETLARLGLTELSFREA